ncbi:MAG: oligosaccharide flippase family protein [Bacteroidetes bacterium]|nr:oligosaccharide flippase family protein [Bacteroidota bacterium]
MSTIKKIAGQTVIYGLGTILPRVLNFVVLTPYYTRRLTNFEYGIFTDFYAYAAVLLILLLYGMETGFFRFAERHDKPDTVFSSVFTSVFTTSSLFFVVVFLFRDNIANGLQYPEFNQFVVLLAGIMSIDTISAILMAKLRYEDKPIRFSIINIFNVLITIGLVVFLLDIAPDLKIFEGLYKRIDNRAILVFYANLIASLLKLVMLLPGIWRIRFRFDPKLLKTILAYSWPLLVSGLAGSLNEALDRIIYKFMIPDKETALVELGIYGANFKLAMLIVLFNQMFRYAAEPFFFNIYKNRDAKQKYALVMEYFVMFTLLMFLVITMYKNIFKFFIGADFRDGLHIVPVVVFANVLLGILFNLNFWFKLSGKTVYAILIMGTGALCTFAINILFIEKYRYVACAYGHLVSNGVMVVMSYWLGRKHYPIPYNIKKLLFYIFLALVLYIVYRYISENMLNTNIIAGICVSTYLTIVIFKEKLYKWVRIN